MTWFRRILSAPLILLAFVCGVGAALTTFVLSFVPYLLEQRVVAVSEAAQHFGMTEDEIRDAVRLIATSGLPGSTGTYQPNDLFDIDWDSFEEDDVIIVVHHVAIDDAPRLSAREAAALIAGLQYLSASPENAGSASLASLRSKLTVGAVRSIFTGGVVAVAELPALSVAVTVPLTAVPSVERTSGLVGTGAATPERLSLTVNGMETLVLYQPAPLAGGGVKLMVGAVWSISTVRVCSASPLPALSTAWKRRVVVPSWVRVTSAAPSASLVSAISCAPVAE